MNKPFKRILIVLLVILIIIQFFKPARNVSTAFSINDIKNKILVNTEQQNILKQSCYDCHSNNTRYPWYANIQPVAWWLNNHIEEGKRELNFSEFGAYTLRRQYKKLEEIGDLVEEGEMPLSSYTFIHRDALLNGTQKKILGDWADTSMINLKQQNHPDSFLKRN